jgi:hypothetical protein
MNLYCPCVERETRFKYFAQFNLWICLNCNHLQCLGCRHWRSVKELEQMTKRRKQVAS